MNTSNTWMYTRTAGAKIRWVKDDSLLSAEFKLTRSYQCLRFVYKGEQNCGSIINWWSATYVWKNSKLPGRCRIWGRSQIKLRRPWRTRL